MGNEVCSEVRRFVVQLQALLKSSSQCRNRTLDVYVDDA